jgi:putative inorganic carbon (HCO3(-)) transporter
MTPDAVPAHTVERSTFAGGEPPAAGRGGLRSPSGHGASESALPFRALMGLTAIMVLAPQTYLPALAPFRIALLTAMVAITAYVADRFVHRQPIVTLTREMRVGAWLVGWAILTIPFSYWPGGSAAQLLTLYAKSLVVFLLLSHIVNSSARLRVVAWGLSLMAVPLAVSAVHQYLSGDFLEGVGVTRIVGYDAPLTDNPNDLALMLDLILPLSIALILTARRAAVRVLVSAIALLAVGAVILTFSRGGFLALAVVGVMYLWKLSGRRERGWAAAALLVALTALPFLPGSYRDRLDTIVNIQADPTGSAQARWRDTVTAVGYVARHPIIGAGIGENTLALNEERGMFWLAVHNVYLEYAVELGLPGLILFLMVLVGCIKSATFVQREAAGRPTLRELFCLARGIQISLVTFSVAALFQPVAYHVYFYYFGGLAVAARAAYHREREAGRHDDAVGQS